jgi:starvation-inducible outer membrane lipoprotein
MATKILHIQIHYVTMSGTNLRINAQKIRESPFRFLELLQQRSENAWPLVTQGNIQSAIYFRKDGFRP